MGEGKLLMNFGGIGDQAQQPDSQPALPQGLAASCARALRPAWPQAPPS